MWRHDKQHNDIQHNGTKLFGLFTTPSINDTQHNGHYGIVVVLSVVSLYCYDMCHNAECRQGECRYAECHYAKCHDTLFAQSVIN